MSNVLKYKGYIGKVEYSIDDEILYGKIDCINDIVTYEADNIKDLKAEFIAAVDDYLETCQQIGKHPDKPMSGSFNVRIGSELHKKAYVVSQERGISLNELIKRAVIGEIKNDPIKTIHLTDVTEGIISHSGTFERTAAIAKWTLSEACH